jgi:hypothetical protein
MEQPAPAVAFAPGMAPVVVPSEAERRAHAQRFLDRDDNMINDPVVPPFQRPVIAALPNAADMNDDDDVEDYEDDEEESLNAVEEEEEEGQIDPNAIGEPHVPVEMTESQAGHSLGHFVKFKFKPPNGSNLVIELRQVDKFFQEQRYPGYQGTKVDGMYPTKYLVVSFSTVANGRAYSDNSSGVEIIEGVTYKTHYMRPHSNRTIATYRRHQIDPNDRPINMGTEETLQGLQMTMALTATIEFNAVVIAYVMPTEGMNRARGSGTATAYFWHARRIGESDEIAGATLPDLVMIPGSEGRDKRGRNAVFMNNRNFKLECTACRAKGHLVDSLLCGINPVGLQMRTRAARDLRVAAARAARDARQQDAQARRPVVPANVRNVAPRRV